MTDRPRLTSVDLWGRHRERCLAVLRDALASLQEGLPSESEDDLNRRLYKEIIAAEHAHARRSGGQQLSVVVPEGRNPPVGSDEERAAREHKIPDFYWALMDHLAPNPSDAARQFSVECKRLTASTPSWNFLEQYIDAGVLRFMTIDHGYGKEAAEGAMVGYLQAMKVEDALEGVNATATARKIPTLVLKEQSDSRRVELVHELVRPFPISPFGLFHLWINCSPG